MGTNMRQTSNDLADLATPKLVTTCFAELLIVTDFPLAVIPPVESVLFAGTGRLKNSGAHPNWLMRRMLSFERMLQSTPW